MDNFSAHTGIKQIVVGVDASAESLAALAWAVSLARSTGADITAVMAWQPIFAVGYGNVLDARDAAEQSLIDAILQTESHGVAIIRRFIKGPPAATLVDESRHADLLVVGSRGRGGFAGLVLGSVSTQCVHQAVCPVVVLPQPVDVALTAALSSPALTH